MKQTVFIETTIPSFYFEKRTQPTFASWRDATRRWWDVQRHRYRLVTSPSVLAEAAVTPGEKGIAMSAMLDEVEIVPQTSRYAEVIRTYIENRVMPSDGAGDAAHLASASLGAADFLLTWNCLHLANSNKFRHIQVVNSRLGLQTPIICTPPMLELRFAT